MLLWMQHLFRVNLGRNDAPRPSLEILDTLPTSRANNGSTPRVLAIWIPPCIPADCAHQIHGPFTKLMTQIRQLFKWTQYWISLCWGIQNKTPISGSLLPPIEPTLSVDIILSHRPPPIAWLHASILSQYRLELTDILVSINPRYETYSIMIEARFTLVGNINIIFWQIDFVHGILQITSTWWIQI